jgi:arginine repressor
MKTAITILIVLNGDNKTLEIILDSLENNIPVLLIRETKGVADLLASLIDKYNEQPYEGK